MLKRIVLLGCMAILSLGTLQAAFIHPGCLSIEADLDRMAAKVAANEQPWKGSWDILEGNNWFNYNQGPEVVSTVCAGSGCSENYIQLARDCARAYQCALRYHGSGNTAYANKAVQIMNAWASTHTGWAGDTNVSLRAGLYGYQFACAGELMRNYSGWAPADFAAFQNYMVNVFYDRNTYFLDFHHGTCFDHYWANWDLANVASVMAIGVLADRQDIFDYGLNYFFNGSGTGNIHNALYYVHPDGSGQYQESGRDQGHAVIGPQLLGAICEIAWNQGVDLYGYERDMVLAACEYIAKYNLWYDDLPWVRFINCEYEVHWGIASWGGRGAGRPGWDLIYNHYVNRMGMAAPYSQQFAEQMRPEGGGINYGSTSGGFDGLGFTTLTHSLDPIADGSAPSGLRPIVEGHKVTLSWRGTPYADSYNVKRSTTSGGPYTTLATVATKDNYYIDSGLTPGTTYYYVVSANNPGGESADSAETPATANGQLYGTVIGTPGSWNNKGADRELVFDGSLKNFFDGPDSVSWAGLDLGSGVSAVISKVRYCPRQYFSGRMVGGKFQGSNTADFSSGVTDLFTISSGPADGVLTTQTISNPNSFRYVRYLSPSGGYGNSAEVQFLGSISGLSAPAAPTINTANLVNGFTANLGWTASPGATNYYIKRTAASGGPYTIIGEGNFTGLNDEGLDTDTTYYYVVTAFNSKGESANSNEVSVTTQSSGSILVARYAMEDDVTDSSGNNYHAAAAGSPVYTTGQVGQAIGLDGADDLVTLPSGVANSSDISVTAWVNWDGGGAWQRIFDFGNDTNQYLFLTPYSGSVMRFAIKNGGSEQAVETATLATGQWVHVAVTLGADTAKLYVNGILKATNNSVTINPSDFNSRINYIGDSQWSADPLFDGRIDDLRIYNYALTDTQIAAIAAGNTAPSFTNDPISNADGTELSEYAGNSLAAYASDDGIGGSIIFTKGDGPAWLMVAPDGTLWGVPTHSISGIDTFTVRATDPEGLYDTAQMTISVANVYSGVRGTEDLAGLAGQWLMMDCTDVPACDGADLDGDLDVSMTDLAVLADYWLADEDLQLYLKFDETSGDMADDSSIYRRSGQLVNTPAWDFGYSGGALNFDGADDHVDIAGYKGIIGTAGRTCMAWIKTASTQQGNLISWGTEQAGQKWMFRVESNGKLGVGIWNGYINSAAAVNDGQWYHVAAVLNDDGSPNVSEILLYINGFLQSATANNTQSINTAAGQDVMIGALEYAGVPGSYIAGLIDDVRIYNTALTEQQIQQIVSP